MKELKDLVIHRESLRQMSKEQIEGLQKVTYWIKNSSKEEFMGTFNKLNDKEYSGPTLGDFLDSLDDTEEVEEVEPITEEEYEQSIKDNEGNI